MMTTTATLIQTIIDNGQIWHKSSDDNARQATIRAAEALVASLETPTEKVVKLGFIDPVRIGATRTAHEMGIFDKLSSSQSIIGAQLAKEIPADHDLVARVMKTLASLNIVMESGPDEYRATPFTMAIKNDPTIAGSMIFLTNIVTPAVIGAAEFLANRKYSNPSTPNDTPWQAAARSDIPMFPYMAANPRMFGAFSEFMIAFTKFRARWLDFYPAQDRLAGTKSDDILVVDVGGGLGQELVSLHRRYPNMPGTLILQDLPPVIEQFEQKQAKTDPSTLPQIQAVAHDFFTPQPPIFHGAKLYFLRTIMHNWPDDRALVILGHIRDAMKPRFSRLLISDIVLGDQGSTADQMTLDWVMMSLLSARERTERQWRDLLGRAGFKVTETWSRGNEGLVEAVLADD